MWGESGLYAVGGKEKVEGYLRVPIPKQKCEIKKMGNVHYVGRGYSGHWTID